MEQKAFSFNFISDSDAIKKSSPINPNEASAAPESSPESARSPFQWVHNVQALLQDRSQEELIYKEIPVVRDAGADAAPALATNETIRMVDLKFSSYRKPYETATVDQHGTKCDEFDIISGVYEGGKKVWECSLDLVTYLSDTMDNNEEGLVGAYRPSRVWELGCGHGLPGCYLLNKWIVQQPRKDDWSIVLSDFNEEVVLDATISNIVLNTQIGMSNADDSPIKAEDISTHVVLGFGDWKDQSKQMLNNGHPGKVEGFGKFDLVLAAETLYSEEASKDTAELLLRHLDPTTGMALIATKRYYFGVGGGVDFFQAFASGLSVETVKVIDNGTGNIREILKVTVA